MSTLKEKLEYIKETKRLIGESITAKGGTVTNNFRDFATSITNLPSGGGTGNIFDVLGYTETPKYIQDGIDYGEQIKNGWDDSILDYTNKFADDTNLIFMPLVNTQPVQIMSGMFSGCKNLINIPLLDTSRVTNMTSMFKGCSALTSVPKFDTSSVTNMYDMFTQCSSLTSVPLFDTSKVTDMNSMFKGCSSLTSVPLFDTSSVTNMSTMLMGCSKLTNVPLFNTSNVTDFSSMFYSCSALTSVPPFDTSKAVAMRGMFDSRCPIQALPKFNTSSAMDLQYFIPEATSIAEFEGGIQPGCNCARMFSTRTNGGTLYLDTKKNHWDELLAQVPSSWKVIYRIGSADEAGLKSIGWGDEDITRFEKDGVNWDSEHESEHLVPQTDKDLMPMSMSKIDNVSQYCPMMDLTSSSSIRFGWNKTLISVPSFTNFHPSSMNTMFQECHSLTSIPQFDTSHVNDMGAAFAGCRSLKHVPPMDTNKVTDMMRLFDGCEVLANVPPMDTSNVINMDSMFRSCKELTTIPPMDTSKVTDMCEMFMFSNKITSIPKLNTSKVTNMNNMFAYCTALTSVEFEGGIQPKCDCTDMFLEASPTGTLYLGNKYDHWDELLAVVPSGWKVEYRTSIEKRAYEAGLKEIGWGYNDIKFFNENVATWPTSEDTQHLVPQADKDLMPMDMSKVKDVKYTLTYCPMMDTSLATSISMLFYGANKLIGVPKFVTNSVTDMQSAFSHCKLLKAIPPIYTGSVTNMMDTFSECPELVMIPQLDTHSVTNMNWVFGGCSKLASVEFKGGIQPGCSCKNMFNGVAQTGTLYLDSKTNHWDELLAVVPAGWTVVYRDEQ